MNDEQDWPEVDRREGERREYAPQHVMVDGLSNGAKKLAWWSATMLTTGVIAAVGWGIRTEIRDHRQDQAIQQNALSDQVVGQALSDAVKELSANIRSVVEEQQELRREIEQNREGIGILDAEKNAIRRDFEREHGRRRQ